MDDASVNWYSDYVRNEISQLKDSKFTGSVEFKFNFRDGGIGNILCELNKSVKMPEMAGGLHG